MKSKSISDITVIMIQYCLKKGRNKEMKTIKQAKVFYVICSVLLCIVGVLLIIFPNVSAITLCYVIGTIAALCGVAKIVGYFSHDLYNLVLPAMFILLDKVICATSLGFKSKKSNGGI